MQSLTSPILSSTAVLGYWTNVFTGVPYPSIQTVLPPTPIPVVFPFILLPPSLFFHSHPAALLGDSERIPWAIGEGDKMTEQLGYTGRAGFLEWKVGWHCSPVGKLLAPQLQRKICKVCDSRTISRVEYYFIEFGLSSKLIQACST